MKKICTRVVMLIALSLIITVGMKLTACRSDDGVEKQTFAMIMKFSDNPYFKLVGEGFQEVANERIEVQLYSPHNAEPEEQILLVQKLIEEKVNAIAITSNDKDALEPMLKKAMDNGISVVSFDSRVNANSRQIFLNPISSRVLGERLMEAVFELANHSGQWAILTTTNQASNQKEWIYWIKAASENSMYKDMRLVDIKYGNDDFDMSVEKTKILIRKYPNIKVICAPTVVGVKAAAKVITELGLEEDIKVTGIGIPSEMKEFIGEGKVCPNIFFWSPKDLGKLSAYICEALVKGDITAKQGEKTVTELGEFIVTNAHDGGTEIILGEPTKLDIRNINEWSD